MNWIVACDADALEEDEVIRVDSPVGPIAVYRLQDGYYATQNTCTHAREASMADGFVENGTIECPLHAAKFCIRSGQARTLPATEALATYPVKIEDGKVLVGLPERLPETTAAATGAAQ